MAFETRIKGDPLPCPKCQGRSKIPSLAGMRVIAFIEEKEVIKKILKHLGMPACAFARRQVGC